MIEREIRHLIGRALASSKSSNTDSHVCPFSYSGFGDRCHEMYTRKL